MLSHGFPFLVHFLRRVASPFCNCPIVSHLPSITSLSGACCLNCRKFIVAHAVFLAERILHFLEQLLNSVLVLVAFRLQLDLNKAVHLEHALLDAVQFILINLELFASVLRTSSNELVRFAIFLVAQ